METTLVEGGTQPLDLRDYNAAVNHGWPWPLPSLTRQEAGRAARRIVSHFGRAKDAGGHVLEGTRDMRKERRVRACWVSLKPTRNINRGWGRLVHDLSHDIFRYRHPNFRPHDGGHAVLEREIRDFVLAKGWLAGTLKPPAKAKPSRDEARVAKIKRMEEQLKRWDAKLRRAQNAIRKLNRRRARMLVTT